MQFDDPSRIPNDQTIEALLERYRAVNQTYLKTAMRMVRAVATIESATTLLSHLGFAVLLIAVGWLSIPGLG